MDDSIKVNDAIKEICKSVILRNLLIFDDMAISGTFTKRLLELSITFFEQQNNYSYKGVILFLDKNCKVEDDILFPIIYIDDLTNCFKNLGGSLYGNDKYLGILIDNREGIDTSCEEKFLGLSC